MFGGLPVEPGTSPAVHIAASQARSMVSSGKPPLCGAPYPPLRGYFPTAVGKRGDGRVMDRIFDHICHGPSGRDRCGRFCTALLVTPKASPPQWGGGPKGRWGTSCHGGLPAQTIEKGSATAMWARAAVLVWKASRRGKGNDRGPLPSRLRRSTSHGPNRPVLTGKCPLDIFPGARTPKGEG